MRTPGGPRKVAASRSAPTLSFEKRRCYDEDEMTRDSREAVRVGVPYRTLEEERAGAAKSYKIDFYYRAIQAAGAASVPVSLQLDRAGLSTLADSLDAFVLPGSPADVDPARYGAPRHSQTAAPDEARERTDRTLLEHAFAAGKPVLAICYGVQLLNAYLGGSLIQDIPGEVAHALQHAKDKSKGETRDPEHTVRIAPGTRLGALAAGGEARVNSSHHQSLREAGRGLRLTAHAPDGIIEAVEWTGDSNWVVGVQWHPERMEGDALAAALFRDLVAAARPATVKR